MSQKVDALEHFKASISPDKIVNGFSRERLDLQGLPYLSSSRLRKLDISAKHFHRRYIKGVADPDTPAKKFGRLLHWALLQPSIFKARYKIMPEFSGTGMKKAKAEWLASVGDDALILKEHEAQQISDMINELYSHKEASKLLSNGTPEVHAYARDNVFADHQGNPILWYGILDFLRSGNWIVEVKSTRNARAWNFSKDCDNLGYHIQSHLYRRMVEIITGSRPELAIIAIENVEPYCVEVYFPDGRWEDQAFCQIRDAVGRLNKAMETGLWPAYNEKPGQISLPGYAFYRYEEENDFGT